MEQIKSKRKLWLKKTANFVVGIVFVFLFFLFATPAEAGNQQITFQGKLTNASGNTVSNGTYYVKLTIYDAATGGSCQYTASSTCASVTSTPVTVTNGIFSINLGDTAASLAAISPTLFNSSALYLGITVCSGAGTGCDSEMTPRKRITAAPYAFNADYLSGLATSTIGGQGSYVPVADSSGNFTISNKVFVATTTGGQFGVGTTTVPSGVKSYIESATASDKLLVIRGNSSQTGNLQEWQNNAGTALMAVDSSGNVSTSGSLRTFGNVGIATAPSYALDVVGFINTDQYSGYKQAGNTILTASSTNSSTNVGIDAGFSLQAGGTQNTAIGYNALYNTTSTDRNTAVGNNSLYSNTYGYDNTAVGASSLYLNSSGYFNTAVGEQSMLVNTTGHHNTASGYQSLVSNTSGSYNTSDGTQSLYTNTSGSSSTAYGDRALYFNDTGSNNTANGTWSLYNNSTGADNTAVGFQAGYNSSVALTTLTSSTFFGYKANASTNGLTNVIVIGSTAQATASNQVVLGNTSITQTLLRGNVGIGDSSPSDKLTVYGGNLRVGNGTVSSTLGANFFAVATSTTNMNGLFYVDSSGNVSASGSLKTFGNVTSTGIIYASGGLISSASSTFSSSLNINSLSVVGNLRASSTLLVGTAAGTDNLFVNGQNTYVATSTAAGTAYSLVVGNGTTGAIIAGGHISPSHTGLFDLGTQSLLWRNGYFGTGLNVSASNVTSTLTQNSLTLGQASNYNQGYFYVDGTTGNVSASGTLSLVNTNSTSTVLSPTSFVLGKGANYNSGVFAVNSSGGVSTSGTLNVSGGPNPIGSVANPTHKGSLANGSGGALLTGAYFVFVSGNYAYVASYSDNALEIIDISNPANPVHKGSLTNGSGGALLSSPYSVFVSGNYAYVVSIGSNALEIIDISNPANPAHKGSLTNGSGGALLDTPSSVFVSGNYAFVTSYLSDTLEIIDISNPANPVHKGSLTNGSGGALLDGARSVFVSGNYAYVVSGISDTLEIIDISNPANPAHKGSLTNGSGGALLDTPSSVFVSGNYAYTASETSDALEIIDISNPANPVHKGSVASSTTALLDGALSVFVSGNYAYVASSVSNALEIIDISNPANPTHKGSLTNGSGGALLLAARSVFVSGNYAYVVSDTDGTLEIIDISGATISNAQIGSLLAGSLQVNNFAQFNQNLLINSGLNVGGNTQLSGDLSIGGGRATTTIMGGGGLTIYTNQASSTFISRVLDISNSTGFVFNTGTSTWTGADRNLISLQTGGTDKFLFVADGSMIVNKGTGNNLGKFNVDSSGNTSASGSLKTFGNVTSTGIIYASGGLISSASSTFSSSLNSNSLSVTGNIRASSTLLVGTAAGTDNFFVNGATTYVSTSTANSSYSLVVGNGSTGAIIAGGHISPSHTNLFDLGTQSLFWRNGYFGTGLNVSASNVTSTLTQNSLFLGITTAYPGTGVFSVINDGSVSTSGTLRVWTGEYDSAFIVINSALGTNGGNAMRVNNDGVKILFDESNYGYEVGIGLSNPTEKLTVKGNIATMSGTATSTLTTNSLTLGQASGFNFGKFYVDPSGNIFTSGTLAFTNTTGVVSSTAGDLNLSANNPTGTALIKFLSGDGGNSELMRLGTGQGLQVGLTLAGPTPYGAGVFNISNQSGNTFTSGTLAFTNSLGSAVSSTAGNLNIEAKNSGNTAMLKFYSNGTEQMRMGTGGGGSANGIQFGVSLTPVSYGAGVFSISHQNGDISASGTLSVFGNTTLGDSDAAGGDTTRVFGSLSMGAASTGNAQLFLKATSTTATPLLIQNDRGDVIGQFASSSIDAVVSGSQMTFREYSLLTVGSASRSGALLVRGASSATPGAIIIYRDGAAVGAQLTPGALTVSNDDSTITTSTFSSINFTVRQQANYNQGIFNIDSSGNTSASGTLRVFGSTTGGGLKISATNTTTTLTSYVTNSAGATAFEFVSDVVMTSGTERMLAVFKSGNAGRNKVAISAGGNVYAANSFIANSGEYGISDVAEYINLVAGELAEPGDVLVVDKVNYNQFKKSSKANTKEVAGVISDTGAFVMGASGEGRAPLALAGLVKVKVTDENGPIEVGDYLTTASKSGYAMRFDADAGVSAGLVGMALEPWSSGDGKIIILVNKGLAVGSSITGEINTTQNGSGQLVWGNDYNLHLLGRSILDVLSIKSQDDKWMIDEDGYLVVKVKTSQGDKELYGLQSGQDKEVVFSGSSQLENGVKKIELPAIDKEIVDLEAPIKVSVTLTGEANGVFVTEKSYEGFTVKELNGGTSNATFDWLVIAKRRAVEEENIVEETPTEVSETPAETAPEVIDDTPLDGGAVISNEEVNGQQINNEITPVENMEESAIIPEETPATNVVDEAVIPAPVEEAPVESVESASL